jgi:gas vesicle protein
MRKVFAFLVGVVIGGLIGASVAMLLAPSSGEELTSGARQRIQQIQIEVKDAAAARRAEMENQLAELRKPAPAK